MKAIVVTSPGGLLPPEAVLKVLDEIVVSRKTVSRIEEIDKLSNEDDDLLLFVFADDSSSGDFAGSVLLYLKDRLSADAALAICLSDAFNALTLKKLMRIRPLEWLPTSDAASELAETISRWHLRRSSGNNKQDAKLIAFLPGSGGVGNTTIAFEAAVALAKQTPSRGRPSAITELDMFGGSLADLSDTTARVDLAELDFSDTALEPEILEGLRDRYSDKLDVFAIPRSLQMSGQDHRQTLLAVLNAINESYAYIFVDLPNNWSPLTAQVATGADCVFLTTSQNLSSVFRTSEKVKYLLDSGVSAEKITIIVNKYYKKIVGGHLRLTDLKRTFELDRILTVSNDDPFIAETQNIGSSIIQRGRRRFEKEISEIIKVVKETA